MSEEVIVNCPWCKEGGKHMEYIDADGIPQWGKDRCEGCRIKIMFDLITSKQGER
jgi:hypothetical protein